MTTSAIPGDLRALVSAYEAAPKEFHATAYWERYSTEILDTIATMDMQEIHSGKYPILATMSFGDVAYYYHPHLAWWKNAVLKAIQGYLVKNRRMLPYDLRLSDIGEMAYRHCELLGQVAGAKPIASIEMSTFGNPADRVLVNGRTYSINFLTYYVRYCFAHQHIRFTGDEIFVELGSGSGRQIELLKKLYPNMTVVCFDLPAQLYLCQRYLTEALGKEAVVGSDVTLAWTDLSRLERGKVYCFGNWQIPMITALDFDVFWNAASFGEMEPGVVERYLSYVRGRARWVYLMQARHGKETGGKIHVERQTTFEDYDRFLAGYDVVGEQVAYDAHRRVGHTGGYFEAVWQRVNS
jgi:putative sugar O-methyltransferase